MLDGLDTIVFDIQDIGTRFYTYISTMGYAMEAAATSNLRFVVLDRPNPIAAHGADGPVADADQLSFVCYRPMPVAHGLTAGELARWCNEAFAIHARLEVVPLRGWKRSMSWEQTGLPWINPSPNIRSPRTAWVYPAIGLLEMTDLSVGRGTDTPFEILGAPWIDPEGDAPIQLATALAADQLPGLRFEPAVFTPDASKHAGKLCGGVRVIVTDAPAIEPTRTGLTIARRLQDRYGEAFQAEKIMILLRHAETHQAWPKIPNIAELPDTWAEALKRFEAETTPHLLYTP